MDDESTIQHLVRRLLLRFEPSDIFIATGQRYRAIIGRQLPQISNENIIVEPEMRDVGPAVGLMTGIFQKVAPDESMVILWGDHIVHDDARFHDIVSSAGDFVQSHPETIVFLGHTPRFANQNLGWIEYDTTQSEPSGEYLCHRLRSFQYRPPKELVEHYVTDGTHAWNLGYFVVKPRFLWEQYRKHAPDLFHGLEKIQHAYGTLDYGKVLTDVYPQLPKISFDNAVLEKLDPASCYVIVSDIGWSDVGAWEALKEALEESPDANVTKGTVRLEGSKDSLVLDYQGKRLVVGIDLQDMLIVNTDDVLFVAPKSSASKVKKLVESLEGTPYEDLT